MTHRGAVCLLFFGLSGCTADPTSATDLGADASPASSASVCAADADCDDRDPRTTDLCSNATCAHFACMSDDDCDDGTPSTLDTCAFTVTPLASSCLHAVRPGRCLAPKDCDDQIDCTTDTCDDGRCRYAWAASCTEAVIAFPPCPFGATLGSSCVQFPSTGTTDCLPAAASDACPEVWRCGAGGWFAMHAAGEGCASTTCPSTPPDVGAACSASEMMGCDYSPSASLRTSLLGPETDVASEGDPLDGPSCYCAPGQPWACRTDGCPPVPPQNGTTWTAPGWYRAGANPISCAYHADHERCVLVHDADASYHFRCWWPEPCPDVAPKTDDTCDPRAMYACDYARRETDPVTAYTGRCACDETTSTWRCEASKSADCPSSPPGVAAPCLPTAGNQACLYYAAIGSGSPLEQRCACDRDVVGGKWRCN